MMESEERAADSTTKTSSCPSRLTARRPFVMRATVGGGTVPSDIAELA